MEDNRYTCPDCGTALQVDEYTYLTKCPNCGIKLTIPGRSEYTKRTFVTADGRVLGSATVPTDYVPESKYEVRWQSEMVPHTYTTKVCPEAKGIYMSVYSKELFNDLKNPFLKGMVKMAATSTKNGYTKFIEPEDYLQQETEKICGGKIVPVAKAKLPSYFGNNPKAAEANLLNDINRYARYVGISPKILRGVTDSILYKYTGVMDNGDPFIAYGGMDYEGAELDFTPSGLDKLSDAFNKNKKGQTGFGHGKHVDHILHGVANTFFAMFRPQYEEEATKAYLSFVSTYIPDQSVLQTEEMLINQKYQAIAQEAAMNQQLLLQKQMQLQANQARTAQILADNARSMSDGLMDSWNKKMDSDSRISQNWSSAIMGTNTYTNSYGQNVDVSVTADHVYQNRYGDVYGVSGNALDQDVLNRLDWTKLSK